MPYASVRDIEIYYEIHGSGPRVLSISGSGNDLRTNPARAEGPLERRFTTLVYDQRGLGRTSKPDAPYTMADYAADAAGLLDAVGWSSAHVVGLSFGGMVAQHLAIDHPTRVERLVMGCTSAGGVGGSSFDLRLNDSLDADARRRASLELLDSRCDFTTDPPLVAPGLESLLAMFTRAGALDADDPARAMGMRRQLDARADHDATAGLAAITAPTLVVGGRYDRQAPLANSEYLAAHIPGARLLVVDGGHAFMLQDPAAWPLIVAFLEVS
jgi:3-oxoadipate enol-lactonase